MTKLDFDKLCRDNPLPDVAMRSGLKLDKDDNEFRACCPFHGEKTPSFTAYPDKRKGWKFHCFGCGIHGDVIDFVRERYGYSENSEAIQFFTGDDGERRPVSTAEYKEATNPYDGYDIVKPPAGAPEIIAGVRTPPILNPKRVNPDNGKPKVVTYTPRMSFPYKNRKGELLGYVLRVEFDGRKITPGIWWGINKAAKFEGWTHGAFPEPRPMYGLDLIDANPTAQVLIVEGEKCADAGNRIMKQLGVNVICLSWMGGGKSIAKTYWKSLKGRSVIIWPDNDAEGWKTAIGWSRPGGGWSKGIYEYLQDAEASRIKIVHITPESRGEGWDIADAEAELPAAGISALIKDRAQEWNAERFEIYKARQIEKQLPQGNEVSRQEDAPPAEPEAQKEEEVEQVDRGRGFLINEANWRQHLIMKADGDGLKSTSAQNIALILQYEKRFSGIFAWNEFANEVYLMRRPPWDISGPQSFWTPRKIKDTDTVACAGWLEYTGMSPKINDVGKIVVRVAEHNKYNPVIEALDALKWDCFPRVRGNDYDVMPWLSTYLGADNTRINRMFGEKWLVSAVARAYQPGCKADAMLVLEGRQGLKKSSALRALADGLITGVFTDEMSDPNSKDAAMQMQGAWIVEIAELDAFRRAEVTQIKSWLGRQIDRFRRPYGKIVEDFPRACVFAGTVNPLAHSGYLKDPTGGRRFWPVEANKIDLDQLKKDAQQLWAEAVHLYRAGETWWLSDEDEALAQEAQSKRYEEDPYGELIDDATNGVKSIRLQKIMSALEIPMERRNAIVARRITSHLTRRGWTREDRNGQIFYINPSDEFGLSAEDDVPM